MTTTDATYRKEICYDRESRDYAMRLDGELVGFARTHHEAEVTLDELVFELLSSGATATATQLDGGSDADECAAEVVGMLVEVAQTEVAHTNAPDCPCDECMRTSYAFLNTLPSLVNPETLVIRGEDPTRVSAVLAHREEINFRQRCLLCGGDHSAEDCPRIHPIDVTPLLLEVDALLDQVAQHPGPNCYCPDCTRAAERLIIDAFMTRLRFDAGVLCSFCGDEHADSACPQKRPLLAPRVCGNCGGQHSIQQCSDIRRLLFAA